MPHAVPNVVVPAIPPYIPICTPTREGAPSIAAATAAAAAAAAAASGMVYPAPTDAELLDLDQIENDTTTSANGGEDQNAVDAPDPSHTGKRKRGKGSRGGDGKAPTKKERRKAMEFEDLVL